MTKAIHLPRRKPTARSIAMRIGQAFAHVMYRKRKGENASLPANRNAAVITAAKQQPAITWTKAASQRRRIRASVKRDSSAIGFERGASEEIEIERSIMRPVLRFRRQISFRLEDFTAAAAAH